MIIRFGKPYSFEGIEFTELDLNLDSLTGRDIIDAAADARAILKDKSYVQEVSKPYQVMIAAKAAKQPVEFFLGLPAQAFTEVTATVQSFLLGMA